MTRHLYTVRSILAGIILTAASATLLEATGSPGRALLPGIAAWILGSCSRRAHKAHRAILVDHERARRPAWP